MTQLWISVLASSLLQFLWQAAAMALLVLAAQPLLRRRTAAARYLIHCLALFALPALFAITVAHYASAGPGIAAAAPLAPQFAPYIVALWIAGIAVCGLYSTAGWTWAQLLRRATTAVPLSWKTEADRLAALLRLRTPIRLQLSARVAGPCTLGWLRPVILLPLSAATALAPEQLRALLAHELAHIRRHDYIVNLAQRAIEVLFFFHPAVWWLSHQISEEREHCCDDLAISVCGDRALYARALVDLAAWQSGACPLPAAALAATGGSLSHRVTRLLGHPAHRSPVLRIAIVLALVASTSLWLLSAPAQPVTAPPLPAAPAAPTVLLRSSSNTLRSVPQAREAESHKFVPVPARALAPAVPPQVQTALVAFTLVPAQACVAQPAWIPETLPSGITVLRLQMISHCVPVIRPVEVLVLSNL